MYTIYKLNDGNLMLKFYVICLFLFILDFYVQFAKWILQISSWGSTNPNKLAGWAVLLAEVPVELHPFTDTTNQDL